MRCGQSSDTGLRVDAMKTLDEILAAIEQLTPAQFLLLRRRLDRLEKKMWKVEQARATAELKKVKITDRVIDHRVMRRRREQRR